MGSLFRALFRLPFLQSILRPVTRFLIGAIAIPIFRLILRKIFRMQEMDQELEKDLEQWFRGSLLLLVASANMEDYLFGWVPLNLSGDDAWIGVALRLMLAVGVIEAMPDQELFAVIHPGPPKVEIKRLFSEVRDKFWQIVWGCTCKHLNRSSPVFIIMTAIFTGPVGWICYGLAIAQYLVIGLVTSRDKAMDVLGEFDKQVAKRRQQIIEEFILDNEKLPEGTLPVTTGEGSEKTGEQSLPDNNPAGVANRDAAGYVSQ